MRQMEKICVVHNKYVGIFVFFLIHLIIFLVIREFFIINNKTQSKHARQYRSFQGRPQYHSVKIAASSSKLNHIANLNESFLEKKIKGKENPYLTVLNSFNNNRASLFEMETSSRKTREVIPLSRHRWRAKLRSNYTALAKTITAAPYTLSNSTSWTVAQIHAAYP